MTARPQPGAVGGQTEAGNCIELRAPARPEMWSLLRLVASHAASLLDFDFEQISDLRLAVDELATVCSRGALPGCELQFLVQWDDETLTVTCLASAVGPGSEETDEARDGLLPPGFGPDELSERIIEALVDSYEVSPLDGSTRRGWLKKSR